MIKSGTLRIFKIADIDIFVHWSWLLVAMFEINQRTHFTAFPMQKIFKYIGMFLLFVFAAQSIAQTSKASQADRDRAALRQFPEIARAVKGVSPVIDRAARNHAEASMSAATLRRPHPFLVSARLGIRSMALW